MKSPLFSIYCWKGAALLPLLLVGWLAVPACAEILYIKPSLEVLMRKSPGDGARIVATVPMGTAVELVQGGKEWARVRMQDGIEGWVRSRFLGSSPLIPVANIKPGLGPDGTVTDPMGRFRDIATENERLRKDLAACTTDRSTLADKYQTLVADPASGIHAKNNLTEAQKQIEDLRQQLTEAQIECTVLRKNRSISWFFTGALVLLLGWAIGRLGGNGRKKKTSLLV
ncbi:MAG: SH3 domain-containing protein [Desulfobulbus sp.]|uniref:SH3 domain-containing protein n=1 Tax=Desulfobulbus sp. TaxID=895 RepID=UPI00283F6FEC|nr:SH3 domain-containing protein [Desulfobulbus sp.]MDR2549975.1 SH3 domain-containing protein [Desulfobulbus sp.]